MNKVNIYPDKNALGAAAASCGAEYIRKALAEKGTANVIIATGASQFEMLSCLKDEKNIDWSKVNFFHLDEYIGLPEDHPAGFRKYLRERFINQLPVAPMSFTPVNGSDPDPEKVCEELGKRIAQFPIDVAFIGIGENGHIAFNDPPADFETEKAYLVITLDEACRKQQLGEGWFPTFDDVPKQAISMGVKQILKSKAIINTVPDERKAKAVKGAIEGPLTNTCPASILRTHADCHTFLDEASASLLENR
ncbi:MAG: glucosamine-6-phosphate deaminase [Lentisphaeria bacterium]|nr:glucosamine-6-phosphate deaminase [Lentisphaerota bacterium]MBO5643657.1 glucosamine-6-phosphate deaminase [Lentisphaeria bacterium]MBO5765069.1 glucosamine-6-phosphate deaminase [Lentisphaeria bacterium]MBO5991938.1 glucosamine-6-phosphate deaminase [Lentisphaeria bacterium]MBO7153506.1 glucosamine-6-phosphate deaminase [Lentisphaeria bacterium]